MEVLWRRHEPTSVRDVHSELSKRRDLAYTTVMTVLDRLAKKDIVRRQLDGRAWLYEPTRTREQLVVDEILDLLAGTPTQRRAVLTELAPRLKDGDREFLAGQL